MSVSKVKGHGQGLADGGDVVVDGDGGAACC